MTNSEELIKKEPSRKLRQAILNVVGSFQKASVLIDQVFSIGRIEGFTDMETGNMIRKEMLAAGYNPRTIRRALPLSSKQAQKTRKDYLDVDKMSSYKHEINFCTQSAQDSGDTNVETTNKVRDSEFEEKIPGLPTRELYKEHIYQESITEQQPNITTVEQHQEILKMIGRENLKFGLAKISKLSEGTEFLKFEIPIPKDIFWQYVEDHIGLNHGNQIWIDGIMNQQTGKILSLAMGKSSNPQI